MVNVNVVGGYDGVTFPAGLTDQSLTSTMDIGAALESSGGGTFGASPTPANNSYLAWSQAPEDCNSNALAMTSTSGWLTRVVAATGGSCGHLDVAVVSGTFTNTVFAIYNGPSFAVGPLAWTADVHASMAAGVVGLTWNGASSPASVNLVAGVSYWIYAEVTGTSPVFAGTQITGGTAAPGPAVANANLTATASFASNALTLAAGAPTSITSSTTLTPQTSWVTTSTKPWYGLRA